MPDRLRELLAAADRGHVQVYCDETGAWAACLCGGELGAELDDDIGLAAVEHLLACGELRRVDCDDLDWGPDGHGFLLVPVTPSAVDALAGTLRPPGWFLTELESEWRCAGDVDEA
jgi:hypothetical protein